MCITFAYTPLFLSPYCDINFFLNDFISQRLYAAGVLGVEGDIVYVASNVSGAAEKGLHNLKHTRTHTLMFCHTTTAPSSVVWHHRATLYCFTAVTSLCKCCCYKGICWNRKVWVILLDWQIHSHILCCLSCEGLMFLALSFTYRLGLGNDGVF